LTTDPAKPKSDQLDVVTRFAQALDHEDYADALALLDAGCVYTINGETHLGPEAIIASYKGNGDSAVKNFDSITYGSAVAPGSGGWIVITFSDHITRAGTTLDHYCEQWARVGSDNTITRIEHHDLPGQAERLAAFKKAAAPAS